MKINLKNIGTVKASTACVQIETEPTAFFDKFDESVVSARRAATRDTIFFEMQDAIYPGMEINFWFEVVLPVEVHRAPWLRFKGCGGNTRGNENRVQAVCGRRPGKVQQLSSWASFRAARKFSWVPGGRRGFRFPCSAPAWPFGRAMHTDITPWLHGEYGTRRMRRTARRRRGFEQGTLGYANEAMPPWRISGSSRRRRS